MYLRPRALALARRCFGLCVALSVVERWGVLRACYSDAGVLPVAAWRDDVGDDPLHRAVCLHAWSGSLRWQQLLSVFQLALGLLLAVDAAPRTCAVLSLWLYASATARHARLAFILDRYAHLLLLWVALAPAEPRSAAGLAAAALYRAQLAWIYWDAGYAKRADPDRGWASDARVPALDAYLRHTAVGEALRALLGPRGLRAVTPTVPLVELGAPLLCAVGALAGSTTVQWAAIGAVVAMHAGIGAAMNGAGLLSVFAAAAWLPALPLGPPAAPARSTRRDGLRVLVLLAFAGACVWHDRFARQCQDATRSPLTAVFHNRWNVFAGSEDHVTWEIMPARRVDGAVVDLWNYGAPVSWAMPVRAARRGRWRSFPMLGDGDAPPAELDRVYGYFCGEYNAGRPGDERVTHFHAYMLQADLANSSRVSKRLLHATACPEDYDAQSSSQAKDASMRFASSS